LLVSDADYVVYSGEEDSAVAYFACGGVFYDGFYRVFYLIVQDHHFQFDAAEEVYFELVSSEAADLAGAAAVAVDLGYGHAVQAQFCEGFFYWLEFCGLNDCFDFCHGHDSSRAARRGAGHPYTKILLGLLGSCEDFISEV
jgi:hypothetical protein